MSFVPNHPDVPSTEDIGRNTHGPSFAGKGLSPATKRSLPQWSVRSGRFSDVSRSSPAGLSSIPRRWPTRANRRWRTLWLARAIATPLVRSDVDDRAPIRPCHNEVGREPRISCTLSAACDVPSISVFPSETLAVLTKLNSTSRFWPSRQFLLGGIGLAISTAVEFRLDPGVEAAFSTYLIVLAMQSLMGGYSSSVFLSIFAAGCLTYFFVPPLFSFSQKLHVDFQAISAFLTTSLIITGLTAKLRKSTEERAQRIEALRRNELYHTEGERLAHMGSWAFNPSGSFSFWSEELFRIFGFDPAEGIPTLEQYLAAVHPNDREFMSLTIQSMLAQDSGCDVKKRIVRPDGEVRYIRCVCVPILDSGVLSIHGTAIDITEQEHMTRALRHREIHLSEAQRLSHTGSFSWSATDGEIVWSEETYRIFECGRSTKPTLELVLQRTHPEDRAGVQQLLEHMFKGGKDLDFEHRLLTPDGSVKYVRTVARASKGASNELEYVGAVSDVTTIRRADEELHETRAQLTHIARVITLGELTASIAHEVNQPLTGLISSGHACLRWLNTLPPNIENARQSIDRMIGDAVRVSQVVERIRALAKNIPPQKIWLNVNETTEETIALMRLELQQSGTAVRTQLSNDAPLILADRIQLQQVILNLIINAIEAASEVSDGTRDLFISTAKDTSDGVLFTIADFGQGLDPEKLQEIFHPFYSTKSGGMGMGLAVSRSIIESHGGRLWATPNEPRGAIFRFTLPHGREDVVASGRRNRPS
jgi:PAS domain S-box-containing protein